MNPINLLKKLFWLKKRHVIGVVFAMPGVSFLLWIILSIVSQFTFRTYAPGFSFIPTLFSVMVYIFLIVIPGITLFLFLLLLARSIYHLIELVQGEKTIHGDIAEARFFIRELFFTGKFRLVVVMAATAVLYLAASANSLIFVSLLAMGTSTTFLMATYTAFSIAFLSTIALFTELLLAFVLFARWVFFILEGHGIETGKVKDKLVVVAGLLLLFSLAVGATLGSWAFSGLNPYSSPNAWHQKDPTPEAKAMISDLVHNPGILRHTDSVVFMPNTAIVADSLVERTALDSEQICFSKGAFEADPGFKALGTPVNKIIYTGGSDKVVKIGVLCQMGKDKLERDMDDYYYHRKDMGLNAEYLSSSLLESCACTNEQTCCALILEVP